MVLNAKTTITRRRGYRKKKYYKRRFRKGGNKDTMAKYAGYAWNAYKLASKLAAYVNTETKRYDYGTFNPNIDNTASVSFLTMNSIAQGVGDNQRTGDSVKIMSFELNGHFSHNSSNTAEIIRLIIFWDKQGTITALSALLDNNGSSYVVDSPKVYDNRFESKTLHDQRFVLSANDPVAIVKIKIPVGLHTQYSAGTTTINTGVLRLAICSDQGINFPGSNLIAHTYFVDN